MTVRGLQMPLDAFPLALYLRFKLLGQKAQLQLGNTAKLCAISLSLNSHCESSWALYFWPTLGDLLIYLFSFEQF